MFCPSAEDITRQALALLPRGRAWQNRDTGPRPDGVLWKYWRSVVEPFAFVTKRLCDLREEFFCATMTETHELWLADNGLPDGCDPFPDVCEKIRTIGSGRCEFFVEIAARNGWAIDCQEDNSSCGGHVGCMMAGGEQVGGSSRLCRIIFTVDLNDSPAYNGAYLIQPLAGCLMAGLPLACPPDVSPLMCLLERIVPAHIEIVYNIIAPPTFIMVDEETHLETPDGALFIG